MTSALVWNVESGIIDVNSEGRYNTQLAEWITNFGESQYSYLFNETNKYTIIAGSDEEDIQFNDATGEWSPALTLFEPTPGVLNSVTITAAIQGEPLQPVNAITNANGQLIVIRDNYGDEYVICKLATDTAWDSNGEESDVESVKQAFDSIEYVAGYWTEDVDLVFTVDGTECKCIHDGTLIPTPVIL